MRHSAAIPPEIGLDRAPFSMEPCGASDVVRPQGVFVAMVRVAVIAALLLTPSWPRCGVRPAGVQVDQEAQATTGQPPKRVRNVTLTGDQKCPPSTADEIVVCGRDDEPYRIPRPCAMTSPSRRRTRAGSIAPRPSIRSAAWRAASPTPARRSARAARAGAASCGTSNTKPIAARAGPRRRRLRPTGSKGRF